MPPVKNEQKEITHIQYYCTKTQSNMIVTMHNTHQFISRGCIIRRVEIKGSLALLRSTCKTMRKDFSIHGSLVKELCVVH